MTTDIQTCLIKYSFCYVASWVEASSVVTLPRNLVYIPNVDKEATGDCMFQNTNVTAITLFRSSTSLTFAIELTLSTLELRLLSSKASLHR